MPNISGRFSNTGLQEKFRSPDQTRHGPLAETRRSWRNTRSCRKFMVVTRAQRGANTMPGSCGGRG